MSDNILEVKKLKISFRTNNGTVKAVRDISFDLKRGETLAIVGVCGKRCNFAIPDDGAIA